MHIGTAAERGLSDTEMDRRRLKNRMIASVLSLALISGAAGLSFGAPAYAETTVERTDKEETVFVIKSADGATEKVLVDEFLHSNGADTIEDVSYLSDIENVSGSEKFKRDGAKVSWASNGNSIRYQGTSDRSLPVDVKVSYYLDGKKVSAGEIAGKSGEIEIHFDYDVSSMVNVGDGPMTHPYMMASGVSLSNEYFSNIRVENGKVINNGDSSIVMGYALPGMKENLGVGDGPLGIPEDVVIKANTDSFRIDGTYSIAMTGLLAESGIEEMTDDAAGMAAALESGLAQLSSAANQLVSGSSELANGISQIAAGTNRMRNESVGIVDAVYQLDNGASQLASGSSQLHDGTKELKGGTKLLDKNAGTLADGATQLHDGTSLLGGKSVEFSNGMSQFNEGVGKLADGTVELHSGTSLLGEKTAEYSRGMSQFNEGVGKLAEGTAALKEGTGKFRKASRLLSVAADAVVAEAAIMKVETLLLERNAEKLEGQTLEVADDLQGLAGRRSVSSDLRVAESGADSAAGAADEMNAMLDGLSAEGSGISGGAAGYRGSIASYRGQLQAARELVQDEGKRALIDSAISELDSLDSYLAGVESYVDSVDYASSSADEVSSSIDALQGTLSAANRNENAGNSSLGNIADKAVDASSTAGTVKKQARAVDATATVLLASTGVMAVLANALQDGVVQIDEGAAELESGATELAKNSELLDEGGKELSKGTSQLNDGAAELESGAGELAKNSELLDEGGKELSKGALTIDDAAGKIADGTARFKDGTSELAKGAAVLEDGAAQVSSGARKLADGTSQFSTGTTELLKGVNALADGTAAAEVGAWQLANGMDRFNKEGIQAFVGQLEGSGITEMIAKFNMLCAADSVDVFYGGKAADAAGTSKIIFRTGAITVDDDKE